MPQAAAAQAFDAFDALPDPVAILAADGTLLRANPAFRTAFRHWVGPQRPPWGRVQPPAFSGGERRFDAPSPDGRVWEWAERVLPDGARLATARDVTRHTAAADEALRAKTTLFATVTHELRTPLNGILGMAQLLEMTPLEANARDYVGAIKQSGEMLLDLITEILDYSRLEAGRVALESAPFDPEAAMQDVAELLSPKARDKGIDIAVTVRADTPLRVIGDDGRLRQILFNLAGNAVKFTESGGVILEAAPRPQGRLRFTVRDTGPGIAPEKQQLIFEEFAQEDASVSRRHGGAGLGLSIVRKLAMAMGGEAGLASRPGQGSSFWVELPLPEAQRDEALAAPSLAGVRVCVMSRSSLLAQALRASVVSMGAEAVAQDQTPDVVLYDWRDDISGEEIDALKRSARALIALVAQEDRAAIARSRAAGVPHYVLKPLRRRSLAARVRAVLGESEAPQREQSHAEADPQLLAGMRVLLAEDNAINALLARTLLTRAGCVVTVVQDGVEAVEAAATGRFDLILLDLRMPRLDGLGAAERIRAGKGPSAAIPIVALTADTSGDERERAFAAGMDDFLSKPINASRLLAVAERLSARPNPATFSPD